LKHPQQIKRFDVVGVDTQDRPTKAFRLVEVPYLIRSDSLVE
jgi:hypothetical protein